MTEARWAGIVTSVMTTQAMDMGAVAAGAPVVSIVSIVALGTLGALVALALQARLRPGSDDQRLRRGFDGASAGIALLSTTGEFLHVNAALCRILGRTRRDLLGRTIEGLTHPEDQEETREAVGEALKPSGSPILTERRFVRGDGGTVWARVSGDLIRKRTGRPDCFLVFFEDTTELVTEARTRAALARDNDVLLRSMGDGVYRVDTEGRIVFANPAACRILGYEQSAMIGASAHGLFHHTRADGTPYPEEQCSMRAARVDGDVVRAPDELLWRADGTSFDADCTAAPIRDRGAIVGAVTVFADVSQERERERELSGKIAWQRRLQAAVHRDGLLAYAQPIVRLADEEVVGHELLVRMKGEAGEILMPGDFLPLAEELGMVAEIDRWMIDQALDLVRSGESVAINLSAQSLGDPGLAPSISAALEGFEHLERLTFEITETAAIHNMDNAKRFAHAMREVGCGISLDDFGTGFGTFSYLRNLPVTGLKIDVQFVRELPASRSDQRIVRTMMGIARDLELQTVAEGVEDRETLDYLRQIGVDFAQGYHLGRPRPVRRPTLAT
jgi:PAS domain S-box-containing protein